MEDEKLTIVEMKKTKKEVNKALLFKAFDALLAVGAAWCTCYQVNEFVDKGTFISIPLALAMLNSYAYFLKRSRKYTKTIDNNLDKELDLEELVEYKGLAK